MIHELLSPFISKKTMGRLGSNVSMETQHIGVRAEILIQSCLISNILLFT